MATFSDIAYSEKPVLVDFSAEWCHPCQMMKPVLAELKSRLGDEALILKVDIDEAPQAADAFFIQSVPTLILFKEGKTVWRQSGLATVNQLEEIIRNC